jgi:hypothetical protein
VVSEFSIHDRLALLLWAYGKAAPHGRSTWQRRPIYLMMARKQGKKERKSWGPYPPQEHAPSDLNSSH